MAAIVILVREIGPTDADGNVLFSGIARCEGMTMANRAIDWTASVAASAAPATISAAIQTAAVVAAAAAGFTVGALDAKTLIGAAQVL